MAEEDNDPKIAPKVSTSQFLDALHHASGQQNDSTTQGEFKASNTTLGSIAARADLQVQEAEARKSASKTEKPKTA